VAIALGPSGTAVYGVVYRVFDALRSGVELLCLGVMPATARLLGQGRHDRASVLFERSILYVSFTVWPLSALIAVFPDEALGAWLRAPFAAGVSPLRVAALLVIVISIPAVALYVVAGAGRVGDVLGAQVAAAPVNLFVSVALVRPFGVSGVFVGTFVATLVITRRYLAVVAETVGTPVKRLVRTLLWPAALNLALVAFIVVGRLVLARPYEVILAGIACLAYGAVAISRMPTDDLLRLLRRRA
jgi:O-antigen/teichoic acid export membrane protein